MDKLNAKAKIQILKPIAEVFQAIINPEMMSQYFIASSTGPMEEGKTILWNFPEFPEQFPVTIKEIKENNYISFDWMDGAEGMLVEIFLEELPNDSTLVIVIEKEMDYTEKGIKWAIGQTEGWANFLACMKAYLEYGINLRKGAFDFMK